MGLCLMCSRNSKEASVLLSYSKGVTFYAKDTGKTREGFEQRKQIYFYSDHWQLLGEEIVENGNRSRRQEY